MRSATGKAKAPVIRATEAFNNESISQQNGFEMEVTTKPKSVATATGQDLERLKMAELARLQTRITSMDALSQDGFGQISAVAELAIAALDSSPSVLNARLLMNAFQSILQRANISMELINSEAAHA